MQKESNQGIQFDGIEDSVVIAVTKEKLKRALLGSILIGMKNALPSLDMDSVEISEDWFNYIYKIVLSEIH